MDLKAISRPLGGPGPYRWGSTPLGFGFGCFFENPMIFDPWGQPWGPLEAEGRPYIQGLYRDALDLHRNIQDLLSIFVHLFSIFRTLVQRVCMTTGSSTTTTTATTTTRKLKQNSDVGQLQC